MTRTCQSPRSRKCNSRGRSGRVSARVADIRSHISFNQFESWTINLSDQVVQGVTGTVKSRTESELMEQQYLVKVAVVITVSSFHRKRFPHKF